VAVWLMQVGGGVEGCLIRAQKPRSKRISCIGQYAACRNKGYWCVRNTYSDWLGLFGQG